MSERRSFVEARRSVAEARSFAAGAVSGLPPELVEAVTLMVSELATNAVLHASSAFEVMIDCHLDDVVVEVSDNGPGVPHVRDHTLTDPSGRGLQIVAALADDWGTRSSTGPWQKVTWFRMSVEDRSRERDSVSRS